MKKSKRDLEMKHKNRNSQTHSKISLQRFEMGEARDVREREWEVFLRLCWGPSSSEDPQKHD
jgi:hypothetical protein